MKVLIFHPTRLPPPDYGGVERVVLWLARGLVERGHETWVAALPGSRLPEGARLLEIPPDSRSALALPGRLPRGIDLVHFMAPPEAGAIGALPCPSLVTVHGNGKPGETFPENTVFLSRDHAARHGRAVFVHNGIAPDEYRFDPKAKEDWALFLSKTSWKVKNVAGAVRLCGAAGVPLRVAGGRRPLGVRLAVGARALFDRRWGWEGPVAGERKASLLARAGVFVFPVLWDEPFGLVVAEALMSGTPVVASRKGSLPELVPPSCGALLDPLDPAPWVEALRGARRRWEPSACREHAVARFHYSRMAAEYEALYRRVCGGGRLTL